MKLNYKVIGEGEKPLIILHGLFGSSDNWMTVARHLAEHNFKCYLLDQRNHGDSPHSEEFSYQAMSDDLKEFITEHDLQHADIMGHSMGGKTAMHFAVQHPQLLDKLIVVDIAPKAYPVHHDQIIAGLESIDVGHLKSRTEADKQLAKYVDERGIRAFLLKNLYRKEDKSFGWKLNLPVIKKNLEEIGEGLEPKAVFDKPTLFIRGVNSHYILDQDFITIMNFFPNASIESIKNAGHWVHAEQPDDFLEKVLHFLR